MKNTSISLIRLISTLMIVSCHILQGLNNSAAFWLNVGVQIFLFISGFLYGNKKIENIGRFYKSRLLKILLPYSVFSIIICLSEYFLLNNSYSFRVIFGNFFGVGAYAGTYATAAHTWFISCILICYLIVPVLSGLFNKNFKNNLFVLLIFCFVLYLLQSYSVISFYTTWITNFVLGYFYASNYENIQSRRLSSVIIIILFLIVIPFAVIYQESLNVNLPYFLNGYKSHIIEYGHVFLGSVIFIFLLFLFNKIEIKDNSVLRFSDRYSYYIYLVHQVFILGPFSFLFKTNYLPVNIILIILLTVSGAIILEYICSLISGTIKKAEDD